MLKEKRLLLRRAGKINPYSISDFLASGGYAAFVKALQTESSVLLDTILASGLKGRGGAGFPSGTKAQAAATGFAPCMRYVVCNADEGEPGTFKDRILMEQDPHSVLEGVLIAAKAVQAGHAYIYIRGEYFDAIDKMTKAVQAARSENYIGKNIRGSGFDIEVEVMRGAGSYLCGEELTLLESLEGKRGYPRIKPPFPAEKGLWGQPTLVNNVETLANLPLIIEKGPEFFHSMGTAMTPGTKLVCITGDVKRPAVYEVEAGCSLHDIIFDLAGGPPDGDQLCYVLLGGAAGTFANADQLHHPLCFDALRKAGLSLGSGAIMVFGKQASLSKIITSILYFFKHESCGKCVPCRLGTAHMLRTWENTRKLSVSEKLPVLNALNDQCLHIAASCLCPLGQSPQLPLGTAIRNVIQYLD
jgi:NADH-quinone oxidoreductase subunit F